MQRGKNVGLYINLKIDVARAGEYDYYQSVVQDVDEDSFYISVPYLRRVPLRLMRGERVVVRFAGENESYMFETRVIGLYRDKITLYRLAAPAALERVQRRSYVRLPVAMEVSIAEMPERGYSPRYKKATALDISAGGMRIAVKTPYREGTIFFVRFVLPIKDGQSEMILKARAIRCITVRNEDEVIYHLGLEFIDISQRQRDMIVGFIFDRMTENSLFR